MKLFIYALAAASSAILAAIFLWVTDDSVTTWVSIGYLFVASIWLSSWFARRHSKARRSVGQWIAQFAISLLWWPAALFAGFLGLFAAQPLALSPLMHSIFMYGFASIIAVGMGVLSLRVDGAELSKRFFVLLTVLNATVLTIGLVIYNYFQTPPFNLSNHYEVWLMLILFVPLAAVNGGLFGSAFPNEAKPFDFFGN